jgi:hypothetical protein
MPDSRDQRVVDEIVFTMQTAGEDDKMILQVLGSILMDGLKFGNYPHNFGHGFTLNRDDKINVLVESGWTPSSAYDHVEGSCDKFLCTGRHDSDGYGMVSA